MTTETTDIEITITQGQLDALDPLTLSGSLWAFQALERSIEARCWPGTHVDVSSLNATFTDTLSGDEDACKFAPLSFRVIQWLQEAERCDCDEARPLVARIAVPGRFLAEREAVRLAA